MDEVEAAVKREVGNPNERVNLGQGFYVQDVLPAQLKTFELTRKENGTRLVTANRHTVCCFWSAQRN